MGLGSKIQVFPPNPYDEVWYYSGGKKHRPCSTANADAPCAERSESCEGGCRRYQARDPAGELLCEFRMYPLLPQVPDTVDDREIDRLAFAPSSTLR